MRLRALDVGTNERPGALRPLVRAVVTHVAPPHHVGAVLDERSDETGRLRAVDEHDVPSPNLGADPSDIRHDRLLVGCSLAWAGLSTVPGRAVETVVDSLRDGEEVRLACDDEPLGLDACAADVAEERRQ